MTLSDSVKEAISNDYLEHAEMAYDRLSDIYEGRIAYIPDDMALLADTLGRYYKGLIKATQEDETVFSFEDNELMRGHDMNRLADLIEKSKPLFEHETRYDRTKKAQTLDRLQHLYTASRYDEYPDFDEFRKMYEIVSAQRNIVMGYMKEMGVELENENKGMN